SSGAIAESTSGRAPAPATVPAAPRSATSSDNECHSVGLTGSAKDGPGRLRATALKMRVQSTVGGYGCEIGLHRAIDLLWYFLPDLTLIFMTSLLRTGGRCPACDAPLVHGAYAGGRATDVPGLSVGEARDFGQGRSLAGARLLTRDSASVSKSLQPY